jgi:hypothetical protein
MAMKQEQSTGTRNSNRKKGRANAARTAEQRAESSGALQKRADKFSPGAMLDELFSRAREVGQGSTEFVGNLGANLGATVRDNPVPLVLLAAGVASLVAAERMGDRKRSRKTRGRLEDWDDDEGAGNAAAFKAKARDAAVELRERVRGTMSDVREKSTRTLQDEPLVLVGLGVAVGALLGAAIPVSDGERRTLGPMRERVIERAREAAREGAERVREGADRVREGAERVKSLAERAGGRAPSATAARNNDSDDDETDEDTES